MCGAREIAELSGVQRTHEVDFLHHLVVRKLRPHFSPNGLAFGFVQFSGIRHGLQLRGTDDFHGSVAQHRVDQIDLPLHLELDKVLEIPTRQQAHLVSHSDGYMPRVVVKLVPNRASDHILIRQVFCFGRDWQGRKGFDQKFQLAATVAVGSIANFCDDQGRNKRFLSRQAISPEFLGKALTVGGPGVEIRAWHGSVKIESLHGHETSFWF
jgi:hypothetical protein